MNGTDPGLTAIPDAGVSHRRCRASRRWASALLAASLAFVLGACGGDGGGGSSAATNQAPTAAFSATPTSGNAPLTVAFDAASSTDADGTIASYIWNFGDGATAAGQTPSHTYTTGGTFIARLTVTDDDGATAAASRTVTVINRIVSGTVSTAAAMVFDSDTNDPNAPYNQNDTPAAAQGVTSPATVGGYLNVALAGKFGQTYNSGDTSDYYRGFLAAGQTVALRFADADAANLDLYLYDNDGTTQLAASVGTGTTETIIINAAWGGGPFYIRAVAVSGASAYTLFIGQTASAAGPEELHLGDDFVPGEVIVTFSDETLGTTSATTMEDKARSVGLQGLAGKPGRAMRMGFRDSLQRREAFERLGIAPANAGVRRLMGQSSQLQDKWDTLEVIRALRKRSDVVSADPNYRLYSAAVPNDTFYATRQAWHYGLINLPTAWDSATGSDGVIVAVVDTGVVLSHPDLVGRLVSGYDFIKSTSSANDGDGIDSDPDDPGDDTGGASSFHGTHVAGTIAATTNNTTGVAGVTWSGKVMPVRVLGIGGGTSYDVMQGISYAAGLSNDSGTMPAQAADIINLSLGGSSYSSTEQALYTTVRNAGIIVVAAAGNDGSSAKSYPAAYNDVVSVSAVISDKSLASYSSYGATIDVAAPGGNSTNGVYSTLASDSSGNIVPTYGSYYGTSMATPHVAGVAALMRGAYSGLTPDHFDALLQSELITEDLGTADRDDSFGYGLIDAQKAVAQAVALAAGGSLPTTLVVDPDSLSFGTSTPTQTVTVSKSGTGSVGTVNVSATSWITVAAGSVDGDGLGTYAVTVDRSGRSDGTYSGTITFTSSDAGVDDVAVAVTMTVSTSTVSSDGGFHYVVLVNPATLGVRYQTTGTMAGGNLNFNLTGVAAGTYQLFAGTDMDNDGYIGDSGESVGAYPAYRSPVSITVSSDQTNLDFEVEFNTVTLFSTSAADDTPLLIQRLSSTKAIQ